MKRLLCTFIFFTSLTGYALPFTTKVTGITGKPLENIMSHLASNQESVGKNPSEADIKRLYNAGFRDIKQAIAPFGYYAPSVTGDLVWLNNQWLASYRLTPGPAIKIHQVKLQIDGAARTDGVFKKLLQNFPLKRSQVLKTDEYTKAKQHILDLIATRGYFDASLKSAKVLVKLKPYYADIIIHIDSGPRYRFGAVRFKRVVKFSKPLTYKFLARFIPFNQGDYYDDLALNKLQANLASSGYFQSVNVIPEPKKASRRQVPIQVEISPVKGKRYRAGIGFGTDTGIRGLMGVKYRRLTHTGHYFESNAKLAYKEAAFRGYLNGSYNIPGPNPLTDLYSITGSLAQNDNDNLGQARIAKLAATYSTEIYGWQQTAGLHLHIEKSDPNDDRAFTSTLFMPTIEWLKIVSDDPLKTNNGYKIHLIARGANENLGSKINFIQSELNVKWIHSLDVNTRMILRGSLGGVAIEDVDDLPVSLRHQAGGTQSVRGYGFQAIGPGRAKVVGSAELQAHIWKSLYIAGFYDVGNVSSSYVTHYQSAIGVGLVWRSPIGAIALSLARAIDKPGKPLRLEFSMGPEL